MFHLQDDQEQDILRLIDKVLDVAPKFHYNPNGADTSSCPFCYNHVNGEYADMNDIKHEQNCAYLLAKDLNTGR